MAIKNEVIDGAYKRYSASIIYTNAISSFYKPKYAIKSVEIVDGGTVTVSDPFGIWLAGQVFGTAGAIAAASSQNTPEMACILKVTFGDGKESTLACDSNWAKKMMAFNNPKEIVISAWKRDTYGKYRKDCPFSIKESGLHKLSIKLNRIFHVGLQD